MKRIALVAAVLACAGLAAQDQRLVFRAGTNLVAVDVYPTKDGAFVDGLTAHDFEVFEDGKPQKIEAFDLVHAPEPATDADLRDPTTVADALAQAGDPYARLFVLFLDTYTTTPEGAKRLRQPLMSFLRRTISSRDLFGVLLPDSSIKDLTFSRRLETLEHDLERFWDWARAETPRETPPEAWLDRCYISRTENPEVNQWLVAQLLRLSRLELLFKGLEGVMPAVAAIREERTSLLLVSDGFLPKAPARELTKYLWANEIGPQGPPPVGVRGGTLRVNPRLGDDRTKPDYTACDQEMLRLTSLDFQRRFRDLVDSARRSNVAFFPVKSLLLGGVDFTKDMAIFDDSATGTLRNLAEMTGGVALVLNDLNAGFKEFSRALTGYYLIGYASTNAKADGKYHRIDVKVKKPHVAVHARTGYVAAKPPTNMPATLVPTTKPASGGGDAALQTALGDLARIQPSAEIYTVAIVRDLAVDVIVELASEQAMKFAAGAKVQVTLDPSGRAPRVADGSIVPGERSVLIRVPLEMTAATVDRVAVKVSGAGGTLESKVDMATAVSSAFGLAEAFRVAPRGRTLPVADYQFRRAEQLHLEWPRLEQPFEQLSARLLGRDGRPLAIPVTVANQFDGASPLMLTADCNLAPLAPGDYVIEVSASIAGKTERALVAFRMVR